MPLAQPAVFAPATEETLWRGTPSAVVLTGRGIAIAFALVLIPLVTRFLSRNADPYDQDRFRTYGWYVTAIIVLYLFVQLVASYMRIRGTLYTVTTQRVMIERGLLSKTLSEIDLRYIDDSQFSQSVLDRLLGIGNVTLVSSDKMTPAYTLHGVSDPRTLRETIRAHAYRISQKQLFTRST